VETRRLARKAFKRGATALIRTATTTSTVSARLLDVLLISGIRRVRQTSIEHQDDGVSDRNSRKTTWLGFWRKFDGDQSDDVFTVSLRFSISPGTPRPLTGAPVSRSCSLNLLVHIAGRRQQEKVDKGLKNGAMDFVDVAETQRQRGELHRYGRDLSDGDNTAATHTA
jgi:hypothetical protein